jgi:hypothetical protein
MNKGDYVLVDDDGDGCKNLGYITCLDFNPKTHLVWMVDNSRPFAILRHERDMTRIDPAFNNLLTSVYMKESENG